MELTVLQRLHDLMHENSNLDLHNARLSRENAGKNKEKFNDSFYNDIFNGGGLDTWWGRNELEGGSRIVNPDNIPSSSRAYYNERQTEVEKVDALWAKYEGLKSEEERTTFYEENVSDFIGRLDPAAKDYLRMRMNGEFSPEINSKYNDYKAKINDGFTAYKSLEETYAAKQKQENQIYNKNLATENFAYAVSLYGSDDSFTTRTIGENNDLCEGMSKRAFDYIATHAEVGKLFNQYATDGDGKALDDALANMHFDDNDERTLARYAIETCNAARGQEFFKNYAAEFQNSEAASWFKDDMSEWYNPDIIARTPDEPAAAAPAESMSEKPDPQTEETQPVAEEESRPVSEASKLHPQYKPGYTMADKNSVVKSLNDITVDDINWDDYKDQMNDINLTSVWSEMHNGGHGPSSAEQAKNLTNWQTGLTEETANAEKQAYLLKSIKARKYNEINNDIARKFAEKSGVGDVTRDAIESEYHDTDYDVDVILRNANHPSGVAQKAQDTPAATDDKPAATETEKPAADSEKPASDKAKPASETKSVPEDTSSEVDKPSTNDAPAADSAMSDKDAQYKAVAKDIINGKFDTAGLSRKEALEKQGYDYVGVQKEVNILMYGADAAKDINKQLEAKYAKKDAPAATPSVDGKTDTYSYAEITAAAETLRKNGKADGVWSNLSSFATKFDTINKFEGFFRSATDYATLDAGDKGFVKAFADNAMDIISKDDNLLKDYTDALKGHDNSGKDRTIGLEEYLKGDTDLEDTFGLGR